MVPLNLGFCALTDFDNKYSWTRDFVDGMYTFRGFRKTQLHLDEEAKQWKLTLDGDQVTKASVNTTEYPFGTLEWDVTGDPGCLDKTGSGSKRAEELKTTMKLNVNTCTDSEFNCDDGYCVDISLRCDGDIDCPDKTGKLKHFILQQQQKRHHHSSLLSTSSRTTTVKATTKRLTIDFFAPDEVDCSIYEIDDSYIRESPPKGVINGTLADVEIGVDLLSILEISEVDGFIALQIRLNLTW